MHLHRRHVRRGVRNSVLLKIAPSSRNGGQFNTGCRMRAHTDLPDPGAFTVPHLQGLNALMVRSAVWFLYGQMDSVEA
jgi:hypothetical protein